MNEDERKDLIGEGKEAFKAGVSTCPYPPGTQDASLWLRGWQLQSAWGTGSIVPIGRPLLKEF